MSNVSQYRYPGVTPFSTEQSHIFFGRKKDTAQLLRLIRRQPLAVLYGKSGLGKSSLLNAAIIPEILQKGDYSPIVVRFHAWTADQTNSPLASTKEAIKRGFTGKSFLTSLIPEENSLWFYAKNRQLGGGGKPLLLFDQFEELFSYPEESIVAFQQEIAELLNTNMPLRFQRKLDAASNLTEEVEDQLEWPLQSRILFAIRSDRMHLLDRLKDYLPNILRNTYELQALNLEDARAAIQEPAKMEGNFKIAPFRFSDKAIASLLSFLQDPDSQQVEGILIQMLCEHYERKVVASSNIKELDLSQIGDPASVVKGYYQEKIQLLPEANRAAARNLIEEGLVSAGEGMRLSLHEAFIEQEYGVESALLKQLVDNRLLRSEPFLRGGYTYELSHDRLVPAVLDARQLRRQIEAEREREKEAKRLRQEAEQERLEKEKARKQLRRVRSLLIFAVVTLLIAFAGLFFAFDQRKKAQKNATEAKRLLQENIRKDSLNRISQYNRFRAEAQGLQAQGRFSEALERFELAKEFAADSTAIKQEMDACKIAAQNKVKYDAEMVIAQDHALDERYADAISSYERAIALQVDPANIHIKLNELKRELQKQEASAEEVADAYSFDPSEQRKYQKLARGYRQQINRIENLLNDL